MYNAQNTHLGMYTEPLQYATYLLQWLQISSMTPIRCLQQFKRHRHLKCVRSEKRSLLLPLVRKTLLMICPWNNHESVSETPKHLIFVGIYIYICICQRPGFLTDHFFHQLRLSGWIISSYRVSKKTSEIEANSNRNTWGMKVLTRSDLVGLDLFHSKSWQKMMQNQPTFCNWK